MRYHVLSNIKYIVMHNKGEQMNKFQQQLKKGVLEMLVLKIISEEQSYGYKMRAEIKLRSKGALLLDDGTMYPILYRLEQEEAIASTWVLGEESEEREKPQKGVKPKKMYTITSIGQARLEMQMECWQEFSNIIETFLREELK